MLRKREYLTAEPHDCHTELCTAGDLERNQHMMVSHRTSIIGSGGQSPKGLGSAGPSGGVLGATPRRRLI
jgi:hypothetical protein